MSQCRSRWTFTLTTAARKLVILILNQMVIKLKSLLKIHKEKDECETAAQVFRCQLENDGTVVNDMVAKRAEISAVETNVLEFYQLF